MVWVFVGLLAVPVAALLYALLVPHSGDTSNPLPPITTSPADEEPHSLLVYVPTAPWAVKTVVYVPKGRLPPKPNLYDSIYRKT